MKREITLLFGEIRYNARLDLEEALMPIYEYRCQNCQHQFEVTQKISDTPLTLCNNCGKPSLTKLISGAAFQFKGSGWYVTDYKKNVAVDNKPNQTESGKEPVPAKDSSTKSETSSKTKSEAA